MRRSAFLLLVLLALPSPARAQHALAEGGPYDPAVPTPAAVLGYELGERFTPHHLIVRYAEAVAAATPRVRVDTVGHSFEGRELLEIAISSAANMARLEQIRASAARLADPRGAGEAELERAVATTPAIVWLGYTVHGNEASGVEAALATLYQLAAGQDDATRVILDSTLVLIDPVQNPDGHERHAQDVMRRRGAFGPDPYPLAMDHRSDWPGARTSHYLFDLNRDWFLHTHPETRARMRTFARWHPHVAVDLHEMGSGSTYFFAPPMEPVNRNVDPSIIAWWSVFARGNADALARHGWGFFTREGYDEFWPGYGVSWPSLIGAVGMTYEQASSGGGAIRREDGSILTLREAAAHHYVASMATLRTAATRRTQRVRDYLEYRLRAIREPARAALRTVLLAPDADGRADSLAALLLSNGIEVGRLTRPAELRATAYGEDDARPVRLPAGAYVVDLAQPRGRLAKAILEPDAVLDSAFIREELERRRTGRSDRFYDVTAWALPYTYRVPAWWTAEAPGDVAPVTPAQVAAEAPPLPDRAGFAYAFAPGSHASLRLFAGLLADSVRLRHARYGFRVGGHDFPGGALLAPVNRNDASLHETIRRRAAETGARVVAIHTALVDEGTDLGSNSVRAIPVPRVALVGGDGTSAYSFGASWYTFEQLLGFPVTRVALEDLSSALASFDVVVLPSAFEIGDRLGDGGTETLGRWVRSGGVLVTLDAATAWLASEDAGIARLRPASEDTAAGAGAPLPASTPGAIVRTVADTLSPLMAGVSAAEVPVMLSGDRVFRVPDDVRPGEVVLRYAELPRLRLAGYLWPEAPARVAGTPYLWTERVGQGRVIAFAGDPTFRAMYRGLLPLFANAVFLGGTF